MGVQTELPSETFQGEILLPSSPNLNRNRNPNLFRFTFD
jgi:hypothetical protein